MKSIKRKILVPFLLVLTVIPLVTLVLFNIVFRNFMDNGIKTQLTNTVMTTRVLIKSELSETIYETDQEKINQSISNLNRILRTSKIALNTELLLYKEGGEMIYPIDYSNTFLDTQLIGAVRKNLAALGVEKAERIEVDGRKFIVMGYRLTELPLTNIPYIVFISSTDVSDPIFEIINMVLLLVMFLGIGVGAVIAYRIASGVSKPMKELCDATRKIGEREAFVVEHQSEILEVATLSDSMLRMSRQIEAYDQAQKAFLQNASHELKTPLMSIQGYAEGIENGLFPDAAKAGKIIKEESVKLNQLLTELLILSRIENQNYDREFEKAPLDEILKEFLQRLNGIALKEKIQIRYIESGPIPAVAYNESLFSQGFMNVATNAIRYSAHTVTITLSKTENEAMIEIADDGDGLKEKDIPYLFDRFYKGQKGQFGLGLAIAKSAIEAMGGTVQASNRRDGGANFVIILPLWKEAGFA